MAKKTARLFAVILAAVTALSVLAAGCGKVSDIPDAEEIAYTEPVTVEEIEIADEAVALAESPAPQPLLLEPSAPGTALKKNASARVDYSNAAEGYVMVQFSEASDSRLKVLVKGPKTTYTYNLTPQKWEVFPLSDGSGSYTVGVYKNTAGSKYAGVLSAGFEAQLKDEFSTFLYPNQYVDYGAAPETVLKAGQLTEGKTEPLEKVAAVYDFVVGSLVYDTQKAATVQSGYLPVLDTVLAEKKGICFDYAALMTGMLRSQGIPCKLVVGYAGSVYHAWISVWSEKDGWIDGAVYFNGTSWQRMDPTFASSAGRSSSIMQYIGDGSNYTEKYLY